MKHVSQSTPPAVQEPSRRHNKINAIPCYQFKVKSALVVYVFIQVSICTKTSWNDSSLEDKYKRKRFRMVISIILGLSYSTRALNTYNVSHIRDWIIINYLTVIVTDSQIMIQIPLFYPIHSASCSAVITFKFTALFILFYYTQSNDINLHSFCVTIFIFNTALLLFKRFKGVQIVAFYFHIPLWNKQQVVYFGFCVFDTAYIPLSTFIRPNQNLKCTKCYTMPLETVRMLIWTNRLATIE